MAPAAMTIRRSLVTDASEHRERTDTTTSTNQILEQMLSELLRIRQALEQRSRPRDADDIRVLMAVADVVGDRRFSAAQVILVKRLWRLHAQSGKMLSCGLYLHPHGIEARCGYHDEADLLMSQVERTADAARARAEEWRQTALAKGFEEF